MSVAEYNAQLDQEKSQSSAAPDEPPPEKNTFIHYAVPGSMTSSLCKTEWVSAPSVVINEPFKLKHTSMEERHRGGDCKPCAYFLYKADGCRHGDECEYCHLCRRGEIKKRKKEKVKTLRAEEAEEKAKLAAGDQE